MHLAVNVIPTSRYTRSNTCIKHIRNTYVCFDKQVVIFRGLTAKVYKNFTSIYTLKYSNNKSSKPAFVGVTVNDVFLLVHTAT